MSEDLRALLEAVAFADHDPAVTVSDRLRAVGLLREMGVGEDAGPDLRTLFGRDLADLSPEELERYNDDVLAGLAVALLLEGDEEARRRSPEFLAVLDRLVEERVAARLGSVQGHARTAGVSISTRGFVDVC